MSSSVDTNALLEAFARTREFLDAEAESEDQKIPLVFGHSAVAAQLDGVRPRRVIWVPGDDNGNPMGLTAQLIRLNEPEQRETIPRALLEAIETFTVYCWAAVHESARLDDHKRDVLQYAEARAVWDAHMRAMRLTIPGRWAHASTSVYRTRNGAKFGLAIRSVYTISGSVLDVPFNRDPLVTEANGLGFDITGLFTPDNDSSSIRKEPV